MEEQIVRELQNIQAILWGFSVLLFVIILSLVTRK